MPILLLTAFALLATGACSEPASLREAERQANATESRDPQAMRLQAAEPARAPELVPVGPLLKQADAATLSDATAEKLVAQGAALRAQAAAIRSDAQAASQTSTSP